jgi:hypothetical protein
MRVIDSCPCFEHARMESVYYLIANLRDDIAGESDAADTEAACAQALDGPAAGGIPPKHGPSHSAQLLALHQVKPLVTAALFAQLPCHTDVTLVLFYMMMHCFGVPWTSQVTLRGMHPLHLPSITQ